MRPLLVLLRTEAWVWPPWSLLCFQVWETSIFLSHNTDHPGALAWGTSKVQPLNKKNKFNYTAVQLYLFLGQPALLWRAFVTLPLCAATIHLEWSSAGLFTLSQIIVSPFSVKRSYPSASLRCDKLAWGSMQQVLLCGVRKKQKPWVGLVGNNSCWGSGTVA